MRLKSYSGMSRLWPSLRPDLLRATRAHFGQLFMLYEDSGEIDLMLAAGITGKPDIDVTDEYGVVHRVWKISDPSLIDSVRSQMRDKKLIIADGHHRYETALTYRDERRAALHSNVARAPSPMTASASSEAPYEYAMMTFVNLNGSGVVILPTHRVVHGLPTFSASDFVAKSRSFFNVEELDSGIDAVRATMILHKTSGCGTALLAVMPDHTVMLTKPRPEASKFLAKFSERQQALDVLQLHTVLLEGVLKLSEESIRNQENLSYIRDAAEALEKVRSGKANIAFLMNPCRVQQVRDVAFAGEVMPQKSTDFYPKLVSGLTIYALE